MSLGSNVPQDTSRQAKNNIEEHLGFRKHVRVKVTDNIIYFADFLVGKIPKGISESAILYYEDLVDY